MLLGLQITLISWFFFFWWSWQQCHCGQHHTLSTSCFIAPPIIASSQQQFLTATDQALLTSLLSNWLLYRWVVFLIFPLNSIKTKSNCIFLNVIQADIKIKHSLPYDLKPFFLISSIIQQIIATACDLPFACVDLDGFKQSYVTNNNTTALVICYPLLIQNQNLMKHHHSSYPFYFVRCSFEKKTIPLNVVLIMPEW